MPIAHSVPLIRNPQSTIYNYSPQSSSSSGARSSSIGSVLTTSSSAPHSAHCTISPFSTSCNVSSASHSGQTPTITADMLTSLQLSRSSPPPSPIAANAHSTPNCTACPGTPRPGKAQSRNPFTPLRMTSPRPPPFLCHSERSEESVPLVVRTSHFTQHSALSTTLPPATTVPSPPPRAPAPPP